MPDDRLARARASLPEGYQFPTPSHEHAEAAFDAVTIQSICRCGARLNVHGSDINAEWFIPVPAWRAPHENAAEQLARHADPDAWNVIEGDH